MDYQVLMDSLEEEKEILAQLLLDAQVRIILIKAEIEDYDSARS